MSNEELIARAYETAESYLALNCETFEADGARFIRDRGLPNRYDANHVYDVRAETPEQIEALLRRAESEFAGYTHRAYNLGPMTPPQFIARLSLDGGYRWNDSLQLVLEGDLKTTLKPADIRLVQDESQWQAIFELETMWWETDPPDARAPLDQTLTYFRGRSPQVRWWLAYVDGVPRAFLNSWEGENGVGQVEDLFTHPDYRHHGLATALLSHCVADVRANGAGPVIIGASPDDTPRLMYASSGWEPLYVVRHVVKQLNK
jgi:GNAT superfamily N-acetyltransferase